MDLVFARKYGKPGELEQLQTQLAGRNGSQSGSSTEEKEVVVEKEHN